MIPYKETTNAGTANDSAISEVIGVILVVALTVIMAAIIASYAFGLMQGVPMSRMVLLTADQPDPTVPSMYVTYRGGPDHAMLNAITIQWPDGITKQTITSPKVGDIYYATNGAGPKNVTPGHEDHIVVVGHFQNNFDQVILETWI